MAAFEALADLEDLFSVEKLIGALEELGDSGFVDLHFEAADAEGAVVKDAGGFATMVSDFDAFDAGRWDGVEVDKDLEPCVVSQTGLAHQPNTGGAGGKEQVKTLRMMADRSGVVDGGGKEMRIGVLFIDAVDGIGSSAVERS